MPQENSNSKQRSLGGRPRKFKESSRPITVTLPERTLELLASVDQDRARAVVKATDWMIQGAQQNGPLVDLVEVESGSAVILVSPSRYLKSIPFLKLVEISPIRFLLVIPSGTSVEELEIAVLDLIREVPAEDSYETKLLSELSDCLGKQRRSKKISKAELLLINV